MVLSMEKWKGKVAVVTGASVGIGAVIAEGLVQHGMKVVGLARRAHLIEEHANKLKTAPGKLYAIKTDITKEKDILDAFNWITTNLGPVHILINNAAIINPASLTEISTESLRQVFDTNLIGLCICTQQAYKIMKANDINGHIIHINTVGGHIIPPYQDINPYVASKHALRILTETLRRELVRFGSKIKITSISPGLVRTTILEHEDLLNETKDKFRIAPMLRCEDVLDAIIYALSTPEHVQVHELMIKPIGETF